MQSEIRSGAMVASSEKELSMHAEERAGRKAAARDRKYRERYKPKRVGQSVFTIQRIQAERAAKLQEERTGAERPRSSFLAA